MAKGLVGGDQRVVVIFKQVFINYIIANKLRPSPSHVHAKMIVSIGLHIVTIGLHVPLWVSLHGCGTLLIEWSWWHGWHSRHGRYVCWVRRRHARLVHGALLDGKRRRRGLELLALLLHAFTPGDGALAAGCAG